MVNTSKKTTVLAHWVSWLMLDMLARLDVIHEKELI